MMDFNPTVAAALAEAIRGMRETDPDIGDILDKAKLGEISESTAMAMLMETVMSNPETAVRFRSVMLKATAPLRSVDGGATKQPFNPLVHGAIVERVQFDGDIPEMRSGPIARGVSPAVPVNTHGVTNPVAIGMMLGKASDKVQKQLNVASSTLASNINDAIESDPNAIAIIRRHGEMVSAMDDASVVMAGTRDTDPDGYRRGEAPKLVTVARPTGSSLLRMTDSQRREMAWKFLSTTQGRVSAVNEIKLSIISFLSSRGVVAVSRDFDPSAPRTQPLSYTEWSVAMGGQGSIQPSFSLISVSATVMANRLLSGLGENKPNKCCIEVEPLNHISDREVGWMSRLMPA